MAPPTWIWNVSYLSVQDLDIGVRNLKDGEIHVWSTSNWIMLLDDMGTPIIGKFMQQDIDEFKVGSVIEFSAFHALVDHCIFPTSDDQNDEIDHGSYNDPDAVDLLKGKSKSLDPTPVEFNPKDIPSVADLTPPSKIWKITYSTHKDLDRGRMKAYDGTLSLSVKDGWISLLDAKGKLVGCRYKKSNDNFSVGAKLSFPIHVVRMGQLLSNTGNITDQCMAHAAPATVPNAPIGSTEHQESSQMDHYSLSKNLDYSPGIKVAKFCYSKFGRAVHPSASSGHFTMVVSFGRASFKLDESSVGIALEATTGGFSALEALHANNLSVSSTFGVGVVQIGKENFRIGSWNVSNLGHLNDYDLSNAISTFGKLLHWHQDDVLLERTICYVAFPSEAKVPRDVVFSKFASVGGVKESWSAVCYILTAEFADALPHDEDQMPLNGNPHPLPGQLLPNLNNFVIPQFPEIGWNVPEQVQPHEHGFQQPQFDLEQVQDQVMEVEVELQQQEVIPEQPVEHEIHQFNESAVINSSSSEGSVNMMSGPQQLVINRLEFQFAVLDKDLISFLDRQFPIYKSCMKSFPVGPILPKDILLDRFYKGLVSSLFMNTIPSAVPVHKFAWVTNCMQLVPDTLRLEDSKCMSIAVTEPAARKVAARRGKKTVPSSSRVTRSALKAQVNIQKHDWKKRSRRSSIADTTSLFTDKVDSSSWTESSVRRCTRHMAKTAGYKFESMQDKSTTRRKPKASKPEAAADEEVAPFIPVSTLQHIGRQLEISEEELTMEKLMAPSEDSKSKNSSNED
ncbi:hypothetical protein ACQ4PT_064990 [Festuca glaucescens]